MPTGATWVITSRSAVTAQSPVMLQQKTVAMRWIRQLTGLRAQPKGGPHGADPS